MIRYNKVANDNCYRLLMFLIAIGSDLINKVFSMKLFQFSVSLAAIVAAGAVPSLLSAQTAQQASGSASAGRSAPEASSEIIYIYGTRNSYREEDSSSVTRTSTALEDIPQSIYVITRDVIDDQAMNGLGELVQSGRRTQPCRCATGRPTGRADDTG